MTSGPAEGSDEDRHRRQRAGRDDGRQEPEGARSFASRSRSSPGSDILTTPGPTSSSTWPGPFLMRSSSLSRPTGTSARTSRSGSRRPSSASTPRPGPSTTGDGRISAFDRLLLANGSAAVVPPVRGADKKCVFVLRTLDDAQAILEALTTRRRVAVLGGGLLGLEIARALKARGADGLGERVLRPAPSAPARPARRRPPQGPDRKGWGSASGWGRRPKRSRATGEPRDCGFKDGSSTEADMVVLAAGVRPNIALAKKRGIEADRGVVVDDLLRTSHPAVYAAGDVAQHQGRVYGIIPASFDQARAAAYNMLGTEKTIRGNGPVEHPQGRRDLGDVRRPCQSRGARIRDRSPRRTPAPGSTGSWS